MLYCVRLPVSIPFPDFSLLIVDDPDQKLFVRYENNQPIAHFTLCI